MSDAVLRLADHRPKPEAEPKAWEYRPHVLIVLPGIEWSEWTELWSAIEQTHKSEKFWLGDALLYAEQSFPDQWTQVVDEKYIHQQKGALWVASRIPPAERRESLSWSVHREVASLKKPSRRKTILNLAEAGKWGTREVVAEIARRYPDARQKRPEKSSTVELSPATPIHENIQTVPTPETPTVHEVGEVRGGPMTLDEAVDLLNHLPLGALPENITEAISLLIEERGKLRSVLAEAIVAVKMFDLPELATAVGAFSEEAGLHADAE